MVSKRAPYRRAVAQRRRGRAPRPVQPRRPDRLEGRRCSVLARRPAFVDAGLTIEQLLPPSPRPIGHPVSNDLEALLHHTDLLQRPPARRQRSVQDYWDRAIFIRRDYWGHKPRRRDIRVLPVGQSVSHQGVLIDRSPSHTTTTPRVPGHHDLQPQDICIQSYRERAASDGSASRYRRRRRRLDRRNSRGGGWHIGPPPSLRASGRKQWRAEPSGKRRRAPSRPRISSCFSIRTTR